MDLSKKSGIVTGGGSGIGKAVVTHLAGLGASVLVADTDFARGESLVSSLGSKQCVFAACDVRNLIECEIAVETCVKQFNKLDFLVNCAGIVATGSTAQMSIEDWDSVIRTNLTGTFLMTKASIPHLKSTAGSIVNIASVAGLVGFRNISAYCASKGGVIAFSRSLALELAPNNIRVNCVCPGSVDTPFMDTLIQRSKNKEAARAHFKDKTPMKRAASPSELAPLIAFLIDPAASSYMTGSIITVDGGYTAQ
jgi:NAD(P)-dependent dehydrogenase (short-subunit alcohol dehydrogenase family)